MFGGTNAIQTKRGEDFLTLLAKAWATELPCRLVWENEQVWKKPEIDLQSLMIWLIQDRSEHSLDKALNTFSESPSMTTRCSPNSIEKITALLAASVRISVLKSYCMMLCMTLCMI